MIRKCVEGVCVWSCCVSWAMPILRITFHGTTLLWGGHPCLGKGKLRYPCFNAPAGLWLWKASCVQWVSSPTAFSSSAAVALPHLFRVSCKLGSHRSCVQSSSMGLVSSLLRTSTMIHWTASPTPMDQVRHPNLEFFLTTSTMSPFCTTWIFC